MSKSVGGAFLLLTSLALTFGPQATWCDVIAVLGGESHHHAHGSASACHGSHDHEHAPTEHEEIPCPDECALDLADVSIPKELPEVSLQVAFDLPTWQQADPLTLRRVCLFTSPVIRRSDRPPLETAASFTGCFLI